VCAKIQKLIHQGSASPWPLKTPSQQNAARERGKKFHRGANSFRVKAVERADGDRGSPS
jgi:hypothetical protein